MAQPGAVPPRSTSQTAMLAVDDLERVVRHLDQLWATLAQVIDCLVSDRLRAPRGQVRRPVVGRVGLDAPHHIAYYDSDPPAPVLMWDAYRLVLSGLDRAGRRLASCVDKRREAWSSAERERRDTLLYRAVAPSASSLVHPQDPSTADREVLQRLIRRVQLHALRLQQIGVRPVSGS